VLALYFPPDWNGPSIRAYNCARSLVMKGCNVTVVSAFPHYPDGHHSVKTSRKLILSEERDGIRIFRTWVPNFPHSIISRRLLIYFSFVFSSLLALGKVRNANIVLAMNPSFFAFFPARIYGLLLRKNIVRNVDDLWPEVFYDQGIVQSKTLKRILDWISKLSYTIPKIVIPLSHGYVDVLIEKYRIPQEKIIVIEHGVDTKRFKPNPKDNVRKSKKLLVYSGNLSKGYDFELIIQVAKLLQNEPAHFIIRGMGEQSEVVKQNVEQNGLLNIEVKADKLSSEELVCFLNSADIFLLPMNITPFGTTADRGLPTKTLEYQALGKPIVCISNGEAGRYIESTKSGLVTTERNDEKVAALIRRLLYDEELSVRLGRNGLQYVKNNLKLEVIGDRFMAAIIQSMK
jgi:colanic acid biosynthesis glycosyl transferase WcaI